MLQVLPTIERTAAAAARRLGRGGHIQGTGLVLPVAGKPQISHSIPVRDQFGNEITGKVVITSTGKGWQAQLNDWAIRDQVAALAEKLGLGTFKF